MVHWGFLVLAFIAGFAAGGAFLHQMVKVGCLVTGAIAEGAKTPGL